MLFYSSNYSEKYLRWYKNISSNNVFNIDNNKKGFFSSESVYSNDFWRIMCVKTGVMMLKIQLCQQE